ncbi:dihydroneopterin triphosphate diphosphatase [Ferriphaselus sp. R-1]|uniref:dihydroneopterin triphosphate diphosphatase n=1 Tax=Ferriphaselus sp. R-1 TaxID=1485544 RepID=UPI0009DF021D
MSEIAAFEADIAVLQGKPAFIAAINDAVGAPAACGQNWDALADVLQDLSWRPAAGYVLTLVGGSGLVCLDGDDRDIAREIFTETARYWAGQGKSFEVCFRPPIKYKQPISALVVIYTRQLEVLLLERADYPGAWQSVTGSRDGKESLRQTALREVLEETGINATNHVLTDWRRENVYEIYAQWAHRYPPGTTHNTEHVFGLQVYGRVPVMLAPREHVAYQWLPWEEAAAKVFSPSNRAAILELPERVRHV